MEFKKKYVEGDKFIFISYCCDNFNKIKSFIEKLNGYNFWYCEDKDDGIPYGADMEETFMYYDEISSVNLLFFSKNYLDETKHPNCLKEVRKAIELKDKKTIIIIELEDNLSDIVPDDIKEFYNKKLRVTSNEFRNKKVFYNKFFNIPQIKECKKQNITIVLTNKTLQDLNRLSKIDRHSFKEASKDIFENVKTINKFSFKNEIIIGESLKSKFHYDSNKINNYRYLMLSLMDGIDDNEKIYNFYESNIENINFFDKTIILNNKMIKKELFNFYDNNLYVLNQLKRFKIIYNIDLNLEDDYLSFNNVIKRFESRFTLKEDEYILLFKNTINHYNDYKIIVNNILNKLKEI